jgi:diacylglycerol kinase family enzyme
MGAKKVVAVGGDGTVNEAVNGLLQVGAGKEVELAVIPRGTGTDFVRTFRIPAKLETSEAKPAAKKTTAKKSETKKTPTAKKSTTTKKPASKAPSPPPGRAIGGGPGRGSSAS